ncbi:MAG: hypothetical protein H7145_22860 [Akkermansiaceae bacterium]|nr:hypothetical protein [Armatimonadota bacterium]
MQTVFDTGEIYNRGLTDPTALSPDERLIYLIQEIECYSAMEGWDGFFRSPVAMPYYNELKDGLRMIQANASLEVLIAYEQEIIGLGFTVTNDGIDDMLASDVFDALDPPHNYTDDWSKYSDELWELLREHLAPKEIVLRLHFSENP